MQKKKESESQAAATSALKNSQTKAKPRQVAVTSKRNHSGANQEVVSGGGVVGGAGLQTDRTAHSKEQSGGLRPIWGSDFDQTRFNWLGGSQSETAGVELR